ncbi:carbon-nitrogen hydrolase family protein [Roseibium aggregatum]|uniref:carbon-nitrogen hydrolase family protein n=1 Tax=Roseibium aggregatum TaxID=187304 RepID=UPI001A8E4877|nr:carbon-nitrogen hydrolase family protein [Roseibium aggregatum]MBN8184101.1 carbon-nitrogen hydrolase family protein [Roseibium aggregatum]UES42786.1 carbon-nitrogen hydrolase family protein [Roseibium aggregatum]
MTSFTAACIQLRSGKTISDNADAAESLIRAAAKDGAQFVQTPEMSNVLVRSREELLERISDAEDDLFLIRARALAAELGIHLHLGSLAVLAGNGKVANRAFLIGPDGKILATYDKIHMFDVDLPNGESWRESATYEPGTQTVIADLPFAKVGMAVCYDIRFPAIFRTQARQGAQVLTGPAAFTRQTGQAHWHILQRSRAIENGAYVISAAQGGTHEDGRETYGHSLIVDPWGAVIAEIDNDDPGYVLAEIDTQKVADARARIPAIANERDFVCCHADGLKEISA